MMYVVVWGVGMWMGVRVCVCVRVHVHVHVRVRVRVRVRANVRRTNQSCREIHQSCEASNHRVHVVVAEDGTSVKSVIGFFKESGNKKRK
jgi:hypothetical protein